MGNEGKTSIPLKHPFHSIYTTWAPIQYNVNVQLILTAMRWSLLGVWEEHNEKQDTMTLALLQDRMIWEWKQYSGCKR